MDDLSNQPLDNSAEQRSLAQTDHQALVERLGSADYRVELYTRLRNIIDNATESIRALKEENASLSARNAEMTEQIGMLEHRIRAVTAELADDELALRKSAEVLEQVLQERPTAPTAPTVADQRPPEMAGTMPAAESPPPFFSMPESESGPKSEPEPEPTMEQAAAPSMEETGPIPHEEPAAPLAPVARDEDERVVAPRPAGSPDGMYTLIAYPFVRFSDLGQFQAALQKLAGVHDVQVRRFAQGTLEMRIGYSGVTDLATTLRTLATEIEDVREEEPGRLSVRLRTSQE